MGRGALLRQVPGASARIDWAYNLIIVASSAIVPLDAHVLRWLADINPMTSVVDATRALTVGQPAGSATIRSTVWTAVMLAVFMRLAVRVPTAVMS